MSDPRLAPFTVYELLDEIRSRFQALSQTQIVTMQTQLPSPPKQIVLAGPPEEKLPKGIVKAEVIPNRFNPDGSPRRLLTTAVPKELQERLTVTAQSIQGRSEGDSRTQFIVKGADREALANSFIQQWENEILELENQLAQVTDRDARDSIESDIARLQSQITLRSESAFGGMSAEEARGRNLADNGNVSDAPSEAAVAGRGWRFTMASRLKEWDAPLRVTLISTSIPYLLAREMQNRIDFDPICGHVPDRLTVAQVEVPAGIATSLTLTAEPSVLYRMATTWDVLCTREKVDPTALYHELEVLTKDHHVQFLKDADRYRAQWTAYVRARINDGDWSPDSPGYMSLKRIIRILNPDFQEREAPDSFYEQTDGEKPYGQQRRPHVNVRDSWDEVEQGPGVFKMSRRMPAPLSDEPQSVRLDEDIP